ncbi:MAG: hypothetical protein ACKPJJ_08200, partial [Planctomycetaceae bacterium]
MNFLQISVLAFLMIPGVGPVSADEAPGDVAWVTREVRAPRVSFHTFDSAAAKSKVSYHLYLPAAYEREPERR